MKSSLVSTALVVACAGCGDGGSGSADAAPRFDARPIDRADRTYVLSKITLPRTTEEVGASSFEFPGADFPVNTMGGLTSVMLDLVEPISVQDQVDASIANGEVLHGWLLHTGPLDADDPGATADFAYLEDAEDPADPTNNLDGTGQLRLRDGDAGNRVPAIVEASVEGGLFFGHGDAQTNWGYELKIHPEQPAAVVPGVHAFLRVTVDETGFTGASASAITLEQLHAEVYPGIADLLTYAMDQGVPRATEISGVFDANSDGVITTQELIDNDTMASLAQPDVDLDGDGIKDHISQGVLIEAVPFELVE